MDSTTITLLQNEVNALPTWLAAYDSSVHDYFIGTNPTCVNFLDVIPALNSSETSTVAFLSYDKGTYASTGALAMFAWEVFAIQRNISLLDGNKAQYYVRDTTTEQFEQGEATATLAYALGLSPDMGITI
jgi:hypothetical protein